jgi:hypothetical protein
MYQQKILLSEPSPIVTSMTLYSSYDKNVMDMYGTTRITAALFPFQKAIGPSSSACMYVCMCVCMYVYLCTYVNVCVYRYAFTQGYLCLHT